MNSGGRGKRHLLLSGGTRLGELTPNGEGHARVVDVDEEGLSVRREARTSELGIVQPVAGERVHLSIRRDAHDAVPAWPILGEPQLAPGGHDNVVGLSMFVASVPS